MTIKAIETRYNGYRFRSRLEARWAVFFDAIGAKYEYEPEGFVVGDGRGYLPDFRLEIGFGFVVDGKEIPNHRQRYGFTGETQSWRKDKWGDLEIVTAPVRVPTYLEIKPTSSITDDEISKIANFAKQPEPILLCRGDPYAMNMLWISHSDSHDYGIAQAAFVACGDGYMHALIEGVGCELDRFYEVAAEFRPLILDAAKIARSARFEHGESPG